MSQTLHYNGMYAYIVPWNGQIELRMDPFPGGFGRSATPDTSNWESIGPALTLFA